MNKTTYASLFVIFCLSFIAASYFPMNDVLKGIASTPAIAALVAAVYQALKDHAVYQKQSELQENDQNFFLGVTSHMAKVAFDKHVEFCEKYMSEVHETISTLFQEGPTERAITHSTNFHRLRVQYATWVTEEISEKLKPFEDTLFRIGSNTKLWKSVRDQEVGGNAYKEAEDSWDAVLGRIIDKEKQQDENIAVEFVKNKIRDILGVQQLTKLRGLLIKKAIKSINT